MSTAVLECSCGSQEARSTEAFGVICANCLYTVVNAHPQELEHMAEVQSGWNDLREQDLRTARLATKPATATATTGPTFHRGGIVLDAPESVPAVWGAGPDVIWAEGEGLVVAGPPGIGKTTVVQQVTLGRCGIGPGVVLGFPVQPSTRRTLYVAADRPQQALRSMRRMVTSEDRDALEEKLVVIKGYFNALGNPDEMIDQLVAEDIGTVVFDSIKDVAGDVADTKTGSDYNRTVQALIAAGIEVVALHHTNKTNKKPKLDDLHGAWVGAGAGSVICLWGEAGDTEVELLHLKQPNNVVGPLTVTHDHKVGASWVERPRTSDQREEVRLACVDALANGEALGREALKQAIRARGIRCGNDELHKLLDSLANEQGTGVARTAAHGFFSEGCPE